MPIEPDPIAKPTPQDEAHERVATRRRLRALQTTTPEALLPVQRSLLEQHHVLGEANAAELTVPLCRNDHAIETERMRCAG